MFLMANSLAQFMGYLKGKSAMMIFERHANLKYKFGNRNGDRILRKHSGDQYCNDTKIYPRAGKARSN